MPASNDNNIVNILNSQTAIQQQMAEALTEIRTALTMQGSTAPAGHGRSRVRIPIGDRPTVGDDQSNRPNILSRLGYSEGSASSGGRGIQGIKNRVANSLESRWGASSGNSYTKNYDRTTGQHIGYRVHQPNGAAFDVGLNHPGIEDSIAQAGGRATTSSLIGAFSEGGISGGLRALPVVGEGIMGAEAVYQGAKFIGSQRAANAQYQAIYGGSNLNAMGNRFSEVGFSLGQMFSGGLTPGMSSEAFRDVSSLGVGGSQRSSDLSFISGNYKSLGMSVKESFSLISTATKNLNLDLAGLADNLKQVSAVAKQTGQSGVDVRALFGSNYSSLVSANPGPAQGNAAGTLTSVQASLGRNFAGVNLSGVLTSQSQVAIQAQGLGYASPTALLGAEANNPHVSAAAFDATLARVFAPFDNATIDELIRSGLAGKNPQAALMDGTAAILAQQLMQSNSVNAYTLISAAAAAGITGLNPEQAVQLFVQYVLGKSGKGLATSVQQAKDKHNNSSITITKATSNTGAGAKAGGATYNPPASSGTTVTRLANGDTQTVTNPVIAQAAKTLSGQKVVVMTGSGKRVVSIDEAIKNYSDQIAKGTATLTNGQTVADALGGNVDTKFDENHPNVNTTNRSINAKSKDTNSINGEDFKTWQAAQNQNNKTAGNVTITPSQQLLDMFTFTPSGIVNINNAARAGTSIAPTGLGGG